MTFSLKSSFVDVGSKKKDLAQKINVVVVMVW